MAGTVPGTSTASATSSPATWCRPRRFGVGATLALVVAGSIALPATVYASSPTMVSPTVSTAPGVVRVAHEAPASATAAASRPRNGAVLVKRGSGSGRFTVNNKAGDTDAVVTLSRANRAVLVLYVRAGASATATKVPDGTFDVYAEQGQGWDSAASRFTTPSSSGTFDRKAQFSTERIRGGIRYSTITLTLKSSNGNVRLLPVAGASIPN